MKKDQAFLLSLPPEDRLLNDLFGGRVPEGRPTNGSTYYWEKHREQSGRCAICGNPEIDRRGPRGLALDHDHKTDRVRGLLCFRCNVSLERVEADPDWGLKAQAYLAKYST